MSTRPCVVNAAAGSRIDGGRICDVDLLGSDAQFGSSRLQLDPIGIP